MTTSSPDHLGRSLAGAIGRSNTCVNGMYFSAPSGSPDSWSESERSSGTYMAIFGNSKCRLGDIINTEDDSCLSFGSSGQGLNGRASLQQFNFGLIHDLPLHVGALSGSRSRRCNTAEHLRVWEAKSRARLRFYCFKDANWYISKDSTDFNLQTIFIYIAHAAENIRQGLGNFFPKVRAYTPRRDDYSGLQVSP